MVVITASAVFAVNILQIASDKSANSEQTSKQGLLLRLRFFWYIILIGLPGFLVLLAAMGYYYTALQLSWQFHNTVLLVFALVLGNNLALRWLVITQRRLAYEETVRKRKEKLEAEPVQEGELPSSAGGSQIESIDIEEPEISQAKITEQTRELLLNAAQEHPIVLDDPAPIATFEGFGDNALNFLLRCYLPNLDNRLVTITELHTAIDQAFRKAGITIAFPQRDVHMDSIHPLEVQSMSENRHTGAAEPKRDRSAGSSGTENN